MFGGYHKITPTHACWSPSTQLWRLLLHFSIINREDYLQGVDPSPLASYHVTSYVNKSILQPRQLLRSLKRGQLSWKWFSSKTLVRFLHQNTLKWLRWYSVYALRNIRYRIWNIKRVVSSSANNSIGNSYKVLELQWWKMNFGRTIFLLKGHVLAAT